MKAIVLGCEGVGKTSVINLLKQIGQRTTSSVALKRVESQSTLGHATSASLSSHINNSNNNSNDNGSNSNSSSNNSNSNSGGTNNNGTNPNSNPGLSNSNVGSSPNIEPQQLLDITRWEVPIQMDPSALVFDFWDFSGKEGIYCKIVLLGLSANF